MNVAELCVLGDLELVQLLNGKVAKPNANYTFSMKDARPMVMYLTLQGVQMKTREVCMA